MSAPARSVAIFGYYLFGVALGLMFAPNLLLVPLGFAPVVDVWARVVGALALVIGVYYLVAAKNELEPMLRASVPVRASVIFVFGALVALGLAPPALLGFAVVDLAAAFWTASTFARTAAKAPA